MSILDVDSIVNDKETDKQIRTIYLNDWIKEHSTVSEDIKGLNVEMLWRWDASVDTQVPFVSGYRIHKNTRDRKSFVRARSLSCPNYTTNEYITQINTNGIINIKPAPCAILISNITMNDLSQFELRTYNKKASTIYCWNCDEQIVNKNKHFTYVFLERGDNGINISKVVKPKNYKHGNTRR